MGGGDKADDETIAAMSASIHKKRFYFNLWLHCGKSWGNVVAFESHYEQSRHGTGKSMAWPTDAQMMEVWRSREVVDALKAYCRKHDRPAFELVRPHPQIPHVQAALQHKVVVEDWEKESVERVVDQGVGLDTQVDNDAPGQMLVKKVVARSEEVFEGDAGTEHDTSQQAIGGKKASASTSRARRVAGACQQTREARGGIVASIQEAASGEAVSREGEGPHSP